MKKNSFGLGFGLGAIFSGSIILKLLLLFGIAYFIFSSTGLWNIRNQSKAELEALNEQYADQVNDIEQLRALLESDSDTQIIEKAARERLGYIYSDEQVFIDISGS